jgi:hypothetical protein
MLRSDLERRGLDLLLQALTKLATVPMCFQISPKPCVLAFQISFPIGNQCPSNDTAGSSKGGANQEHCLDTLKVCVEAVLDRSEDLCANCCSCFANACEVSASISDMLHEEPLTLLPDPGSDHEVESERIQRLCLNISLFSRHEMVHHIPHKNVATPGPISPKALKMPYSTTNNGKID